MRKSKYTVGNFNLKVKKSATGKGLFAVDPIPKNSCIIEYIGTPVPEADQEKGGRYFFWTGKKTMINGNIPENKARYINHSCRPNCEAEGPNGHIYILSIRNIKAGEELTYNYGTEYFETYLKPKGCKCVKCTTK